MWTVCGSGRLCSQRKRQCLEETALCREWSGNLVFVCLFVLEKGFTVIYSGPSSEKGREDSVFEILICSPNAEESQTKEKVK